MPKNLGVRVRRMYFDDIVSGKKDKELRPDTPYWHKKFVNFDTRDYIGGTITFVCGKDVHRRLILGIVYGWPEEFLGRPLSEQGKKDILPEKRLGNRCFAIMLGDELPEKGQNIGRG